AESWNFALQHTPLVNRKGLFVLMETRWCFGNRADAQTEQNARSRFGITLKIPMESSFALRFSHAVMRQREVIHSNFNVAGALQPGAGHFVERAFLAGLWDVFIGVTALCRFDPRHEGKAVERNSIGP